MKKNKIEDIKGKLIPTARYDEKLHCFHQENGIYTDLYQIVSKDLVNGDPDEIEMDCFTWAKFYKTYGMDVEIISLMYPCNTTKQQEYWKHIAEKNQNPDFEPMIRKKISELEYRERYTVKKEFFLQFFWKTEAEIKSGRKAIESVIGVRKLHENVESQNFWRKFHQQKRNRFYLRLQIKIHKYFNVPDFGT